EGYDALRSAVLMRAFFLIISKR
ncbi:conjugal transfer protein TraA, partial [Salmonella enterica subsp. enterica]|nr:conjugal transfer protein TraA [Salmonella enterica subsp. enterica]